MQWQRRKGTAGFILLLVLCLLLPGLAHAAAPEISADAAIVVDRGTGTVLYEKMRISGSTRRA